MICEERRSVDDAFIDAATCYKKQQDGACPSAPTHQGIDSKANNGEILASLATTESSWQLLSSVRAQPVVAVSAFSTNRGIEGLGHLAYTLKQRCLFVSLPKIPEEPYRWYHQEKAPVEAARVAQSYH
jgi:hypothetical protein